MADKALSMLRDAAETPCDYLTTAKAALGLFETALHAEKYADGMGMVDPDIAGDTGEISGIWAEVVAALNAASASIAPEGKDEKRLQVVLSRIASAVKDLDAVESDPAIWLQVHLMEKGIREEAPSAAITLLDEAMFLLASYLDMMRVIDLEDFDAFADQL